MIKRTPTATKQPKYILVKEFILYYENKGIKVFDSSAKRKEEYCGPIIENNFIHFKGNKKILIFYYYKKCLVFEEYLL
jgi:hypothetical protein